MRAASNFHREGMARGSIYLGCGAIASGPFLGIFPHSLLRFGSNLPPLKILPVELPMPPLPIGIMTLKKDDRAPWRNYSLIASANSRCRWRSKGDRRHVRIWHICMDRPCVASRI